MEDDEENKFHHRDLFDLFEDTVYGEIPLPGRSNHPDDYYHVLLELLRNADVESWSLTSLFDLLFEVCFILQVNLKKGQYWEDPLNPEIRVYPNQVNVLGNDRSEKIFFPRHQFQSDELSKYFKSLASQVGDMKEMVLKAIFISSEYRAKWNISIYRHLQSFFYQVMYLENQLAKIDSLAFRKRIKHIYRQIRYLKNKINKLKQDVNS